MGLAELLSVLRRQWLLLAGVVALFVIAAGVVSVEAPKAYESQTQLFLGTRVLRSASGDASASAYSGGLFLNGRVQSYAAAVTSEQVLVATASKLRLSKSPAELATQVRADVPPDTTLINIVVSDQSARGAQQIAA